ncbi:MAG: hypothetical protein ABIX10_08950 [Acidimicrobiales bacterium]
MRRTMPYVIGWFGVGVLAVLLASAAVSMVGRQVTGSRPAPLSAEQVRDELAALPADPELTTTTTDPTPSTTLAIPPTTPADAPGAAGPATPTTVPGPAAPRSDPGPGQVTPSPPPPALSPTTSVVAAPAPSTRTYDLVGGTATLRFAPEGVEVLAATPDAGFSVDVSNSHDNGVRVEFDRDDHRSRVDAWWDGGPQEEVREED